LPQEDGLSADAFVVEICCRIIHARTSSTRHAVIRCESLTGRGKSPDLTFRHRVADEKWIKPGTKSDWRMNPAEGKAMLCIVSLGIG
jgi:protoheme ferro-lyase